MKTLNNKKENILKTIEKIKEYTAYLEQTLDILNTDGHTIEKEKQLVYCCHTIQTAAKTVIAQTGYYKALATEYRAKYAPEELDGDPSDLKELVRATLDDIEYPKVNRVYKINLDNPEPGKLFDVIEEPVEEPTKAVSRELEDQNFTREEWEEAIRNQRASYSNVFEHSNEDHDVFFDEDIIAAAKGFMLGPVSIQRNRGISAETYKFPALAELKNFVLNVMCKNKDMILYTTFTQEVTDWTGVDSKNKGSFEFIEKLPKVTSYVFRGVFLDKE